MKLFIDTANVDHIREIANWGILEGVTTNPSLAAKEGRNFAEMIYEICEIVDGPVSAEVVAPDTEGMLREARLLTKIHDNVIIKVPICANGLAAVRVLTEEKIRTNVTLIFSANQALAAASAGATFVSPFVGRVDDIGGDGIELVAEIVEIFNNYAYQTEVISASIRHPYHVLESARVGSQVATIPYKVFNQMLLHPQTDLGMEAFLDDWKKVPGGDNVEKVVTDFLKSR